MSDNGYVIAYRRVWKHPVFRDLLDAGIWNYLYQNAAWRDARVFLHGTRVDLRRGQIFVSLRSLAEGFCCPEPRVRRLINSLRDDAMIEVLPTHRGTVITICNYEDYQAPQLTADAVDSVPEAHKQRANDAPYKEKETKQQKNTPYPPDFDVFWTTYPKNNGSKKDAAKAYQRAALRVGSPDVILHGATRYAAYIASRVDGLQFTKHAATWLNGHFWESDWSVPPTTSGTYTPKEATRRNVTVL
jgi:hypothetical protein